MAEICYFPVSTKATLGTHLGCSQQFDSLFSKFDPGYEFTGKIFLIDVSFLFYFHILRGFPLFSWLALTTPSKYTKFY